MFCALVPVSPRELARSTGMGNRQTVHAKPLEPTPDIVVVRPPPKKYRNGNSIVVSTIAGGADGGGSTGTGKDGIGTAAAFQTPHGICRAYGADGDALLITETASHRIRCVLPASEQRKSDVSQMLLSALFESGAVPIQALISIIHDFAIGDSTSEIGLSGMLVATTVS